MTKSTRVDQFGLFDSIEEHFCFVKSNPKNQRGKDSIHWMAPYMDTLFQYSIGCEHITEIGVNQVNSTWALLRACPKRIVLIDVDFHRNPTKNVSEFCNCNLWLSKAIELCIDAGIEIRLIEADSAKIDIESTDLLFIDSNHTTEHLSAELDRHSKWVRRYIIIHDTTLFKKQLWPPIEKLLDSKEFILIDRIMTDCGMTILERNA